MRTGPSASAPTGGTRSTPERLKETVQNALKHAFRPEFLNRIDEIIVFRPLSQEEIERIVDLMAEDVLGRLKDRGISFELTQAAREWLSREGFDPAFGARPLRRSIQRHLETPLSREILSGGFVEGDNILVDAGDSSLVFAKKEAKVEEPAPLG